MLDLIWSEVTTHSTTFSDRDPSLCLNPPSWHFEGDWDLDSECSVRSHSYSIWGLVLSFLRLKYARNNIRLSTPQRPIFCAIYDIKQSARDKIKAASCSPEICPESSEFVVRIFSVTLSKITGLVVVNQFEVTGVFKSIQQPIRGMDSSLSANQRRGGAWRWQTCHWQEIKCQ